MPAVDALPFRLVLGFAVMAGISVGFGPGATTVALSIVICCAMAVNFPFGIFAAIGIKPAVDCLWAIPVIDATGLRLNAQSIVGMVIPAAAFALASRRLKAWRVSAVERTALYFAAATLLGVLLSATKGAAVNDAAKILIPISLIAAGRLLIQQGVTIHQISVVLASYGIVPLVSGLFELTGIIGHPEGAEPTPGGVYRISGYYHHPLDIVIRCAVALPFALSLVSLGRSKFVRVGMAMWSMAMVVISFATLVRSALGIISLELVGWAWLRGRRWIAAFVLGVAAATMLVAAPIQRVIQDAVRPLQEGAVYELGTGRALLYAAQVSAFASATPLEKLFGRGLHSTQAAIVEYSPIRVEALEERYEGGGGVGSHNQYLRILGENGITGLLAFLVLMGSVCLLAVRLMKRGHGGTSTFGAAVLTAILTVLAFGMALTPFDSPGFTWPLWLAVGCALELDTELPARTDS